MLPQAGAIQKIQKDKSIRTVFLQGLVASAAPMFFASIAERWKTTTVFVLNDNDEAGYFYNDLKTIAMPADGEGKVAEVLFFPSSYRRAVKYGQRDAGNEILRTEVLTRLSALASDADNALPLYIVTEPSALSELVVSKKQLDERRLTLTVDQHIDIVEVEKTLRSFGFTETDYVYEPGQFAMRGSIIDVYSFSNELPFRIDFFGDDIETIRNFEVETQLSTEKLTRVEIVPELTTMSEEKVPFLQFLPEDAVLAFKDFLYVRDAIDNIYQEGFTNQALTEKLEGKTELEQRELEVAFRKEGQLVPASRWMNDALDFRRIEFGMNYSSSDLAKKKDGSRVTINFSTSPQPLFHKNFDLLSKTLRDYLLQGYKLYIFADSEKQTIRLRDIFDSLSDTNVSPDSENLSVAELSGEGQDATVGALPFTPVNRTLHEGFVDSTLKVCFFTDHQIFDRFHKYNLKSDKARQGKMALTMKELQEMEPGDFLVHVDFGIGKFAGLVRVPAGESYQEMIRLVYQHNDIVDVSIHSLYKISKYRRGDSGEAPRLSVLGSGAWDRLKEKAKKRIKDIARDLIKLYAKRRREKGFAFSPDSFMQHELEASFLYEDTPDQLKATQELKQDMESARPMDRLVCGDVGFGKTEVAIRAAFKAAVDNKQVAVLVPTTVLAFQHYQTFKKRLKDMPVRVDYLSRARSAKQTKQVLEDLAEGKIDILVGTHKLIGKSVKWHDLGLLIIDEEQKFGVSTKEKLRQLKTNVDTLTMSATPIPRTLQFSLMGARDMSIMRTPPPNRYPIQTEIASFSHEVIADAINFEMSRNGQVYFVNDRISNLPEIANLIKKYVPDCRIAIGHGQMKPEELEEIVMGFMNYDYDVLLSTTIVENGIDISNANTIIINDAHRFGLSDLHQMRGRVGRSNKKAFCYLLAPPLAALNPEARRRLEALETFSDLGSGFNLAMQDLDIRGAGNLLGSQQHGNIASVGFGMYVSMLEEAIAKAQNKEVEREVSIDPAIDLEVDAFIDDAYIKDSARKISVYQRLLHIKSKEQLDDMTDELIDRFGTPTDPVDRLLRIAQIKEQARLLGIKSIVRRDQQLTIHWHDDSKMADWDMGAVREDLWKKMKFADTKPATLYVSLNGMKGSILTITEAVMKALSQKSSSKEGL